MLALVCSIIMYILAAPILYTIISNAVGGMGDMEGFICKLFLWFVLLILFIMLFNTIKNRGGFLTA